MSQPYRKGWLSYADQVQLLQHRGLIVSDLRKAEQFLSHLNYYRFSGYCLAFESQRHTFVTGTTFEQIVDAYQFDLGLRDLVTEALEIIEVDLRAAIAYFFGQRYGAFGHTVATNFYVGFGHTDWLLRLQEEAHRSSELFVTHFQRAYIEFPISVHTIHGFGIAFGQSSRHCHTAKIGLHQTCAATDICLQH